MGKRKKRKVSGSFTVEAALIMPAIIFLVIGLLHLGMSLEREVMDLAQQEVLVKELDPVEEMYRMHFLK